MSGSAIIKYILLVYLECIYSNEKIFKKINNKHKFFLIEINDHIKSNNAGITNLMHLHPSFKFVKKECRKIAEKGNLFALTCAI